MCDAQALPPETQSGHPKPKKCLPTKQQQKNSTHTASLTVTHPLIPSQEGKQIHSNLSFPNRKAASKSPLSRGAGGVSRPRTATQIKSNHLKSTDNTLQHQASRSRIPQPFNPCRASHRNTPLKSPLKRGNKYTQTSHYQQERSARTSPLERGRGCVTSKHSHLKSKHPPEANKQHLKKKQQKHLNPHRTPHHNTPLYPLSRGETNTTIL